MFMVHMRADYQDSNDEAAAPPKKRAQQQPGLRILIAANTNVAVDRVLQSLQVSVLFVKNPVLDRSALLAPLCCKSLCLVGMVFGNVCLSSIISNQKKTPPHRHKAFMTSCAWAHCSAWHAVCCPTPCTAQTTAQTPSPRSRRC